MTTFLRFLRHWMLAVSMSVGIGSYFLWTALPFAKDYDAEALEFIGQLQPILIFAMLFVTFCKVDPHRLSLRKWHLFHLLFQNLGFTGMAALFLLFPQPELLPVWETGMLCLICPTATAAAVVTEKLGGDVEGLTTYSLLINLIVAFVLPMIVPLLYPHPYLTFSGSFFLIVGKLFPMLILPFFSAMIVRILFKKLHTLIVGLKDFAFYIWAVSLALAMTVSTKSLMESEASWLTLLGIGIISLGTCILQFHIGRRIGMHYDNPVAAAQALGQKNTVFIIWAGYTFFDPLSSISGGFYAIYHNIRNSNELFRHNKAQKRKADT